MIVPASTFAKNAWSITHLGISHRAIASRVLAKPLFAIKAVKSSKHVALMPSFGHRPKHQHRRMSDTTDQYGRPETPSFRHTEFALQQIAFAVANAEDNYTVINGSREHYTTADGCIAMRILTALHRGSRFTLSERSVADIFRNNHPFRNRDTHDWGTKYSADSMLCGINIQKEILSHLLGRDPVVVEEKDNRGNITSAEFSC